MTIDDVLSHLKSRYPGRGIQVERAVHVPGAKYDQIKRVFYAAAVMKAGSICEADAEASYCATAEQVEQRILERMPAVANPQAEAVTA